MPRVCTLRHSKQYANLSTMNRPWHRLPTSQDSTYGPSAERPLLKVLPKPASSPHSISAFAFQRPLSITWHVYLLLVLRTPPPGGELQDVILCVCTYTHTPSTTQSWACNSHPMNRVDKRLQGFKWTVSPWQDEWLRGVRQTVLSWPAEVP